MVEATVLPNTAGLRLYVSRVGEMNKVRVPGTPGGYMWQATELTGGVGLVNVTRIVEFDLVRYGEPEPIGGVADREFVFVTNKVGEASATLLLSQPWESLEKVAPLRCIVVKFETSSSEPLAAPEAF